MPTISVFYGIIVRMYYDDHAPPHFHAYYAGQEALIKLETLEIMEGDLPRRAYSLLLEWASAHRIELKNNWERAQRHEPVEAIDPLA